MVDLLTVRNESQATSSRKAGPSAKDAWWPFGGGDKEKKVDMLVEDDFNYARAQGLDFDPDKEYTAPEKVSISQTEKEELIQAQRQKEEALHDCLSVTACQLLRKNIEKVMGRQRKWYTLGLWQHQKRQNLLDKVVSRCLGHTDLVGPNWNANCIACPTGLMGGSKFGSGRFGYKKDKCYYK